MVREVIITGPEGRLEGRFHQAEQSDAPIALVLHPHPLHGGNMNNKIVYLLFQAFAALGFSVLRFNFRGVGKSQGIYNNGVGELIDAAAAMDWLQLQCPDHNTCWVAGFSFGAWISAQLLMRRPEIEAFIKVAPPVSLYDFGFLSPCPAQGLIIQGTQDKIVREDAVRGLYERLGKQRSTLVEYHSLDADHFFTGQLDTVSAIVSEYIKDKAIRAEVVTKKIRRDRRRRNVA